MKSCAPCPVDTAQVRPRGLRDDRRWMVVDANGRFVTGREEPRMTLIRARPQATGALLLEADGMPSLDVPRPGAEAARTGVTVWKSAVDAALCGADADRWLSEVLQRPVQLVHMDAHAVRPITSERARAGDEVSFADAFPLLLISQAALDALNARLARPVPITRFRPNLVIDGVAPHAEDGWQRVAIGDIEFDVAKPCGRCVFTTVDPATGERDPDGEPLRTLIGYRRGEHGVTFGQYLVPRGGGVLHRDAPLTVL